MATKKKVVEGKGKKEEPKRDTIKKGTTISKPPISSKESPREKVRRRRRNESPPNSPTPEEQREVEEVEEAEVEEEKVEEDDDFFVFTRADKEVAKESGSGEDTDVDKDTDRVEPPPQQKGEVKPGVAITDIVKAITGPSPVISAEQIIKQDKEYQFLSSISSRILEAAHGMEIREGKDTYAKALSTLMAIRDNRETVKKRQQFFIGPLEEHIRNIKAMFDNIDSPLAEAEGILNGKMVDYQMDEEARGKPKRKVIMYQPPSPETSPAEAGVPSEADDDIFNMAPSSPSSSSKPPSDHDVFDFSAEDDEFGFHYTPPAPGQESPPQGTVKEVEVDEDPTATKTIRAPSGTVSLRKKLTVIVNDKWKFMEAVIRKDIPLEAVIVNLKFIEEWLKEKQDKIVPGCDVIIKASQSVRKKRTA